MVPCSWQRKLRLHIFQVARGSAPRGLVGLSGNGRARPLSMPRCGSSGLRLKATYDRRHLWDKETPPGNSASATLRLEHLSVEIGRAQGRRCFLLARGGKLADHGLRTRRPAGRAGAEGRLSCSSPPPFLATSRCGARHLADLVSLGSESHEDLSKGDRHDCRRFLLSLTSKLWILTDGIAALETRKPREPPSTMERDEASAAAFRELSGLTEVRCALHGPVPWGGIAASRGAGRPAAGRTVGPQGKNREISGARPRQIRNP